MTAKNLGAIPGPGELTNADQALLASSRAAFGSVGELLGKSRQKAAINDVMRVVGEANKYLSDMEPWKLKTTDPDRMASVLHTALQVVDDVKTMMTPFLPASSSQIFEALGGTGAWAAMPELTEVEEETAVGSPSYTVLTGDYQTQATWASVPLPVGRPMGAPTPVFTKLDPSIVDEELERLSAKAAEATDAG
jgi:methionyl-tRNA synthetase